MHFRGGTAPYRSGAHVTRLDGPASGWLAQAAIVVGVMAVAPRISR